MIINADRFRHRVQPVHEMRLQQDIIIAEAVTFWDVLLGASDCGVHRKSEQC